MWARIVETTLGLWLILSPFIFRHERGEPLLWIVDFSAGVAVVAVALLSVHPAQRRLHLAQLMIASFLLGLGWIGRGGPAQANWIVTALLLLMLGVIPGHAARPPAAWERFFSEMEEKSDC